ncbi:MAG: CPBP family intramembrane metalloprotease [Pirellulales bacterium]
MKPWTWDVDACLTGLLWTLPPVAALVYARSSSWRPIANFQRLMEMRVRPLFATLSIPHLLILSAAAGFGEELLFRGLLQPLLIVVFDMFETRPGVAWAVIGLTSLAFGALHALSPVYFVLATVMSVYLGWLMLRTENLAVPILVHALYDAVALIWLCKADSPERTSGE